MGEANMIAVVFLQDADVFSIISYTLKEYGSKFKEQHEGMNKVSRWVYKSMKLIQLYHGKILRW